jgi:hypothetical protein
MKRKTIPAMLLILLFSGFIANSQSIPEVTVRFNNPVYDCPTQTYCLDVEFKSNTPGQQLFGMNLRFFYDDNVLEYIGTNDFAQGYGMPQAPAILNGSGARWGLAGSADWVNGSVELQSASSVLLPTDGWVKLFGICFHVDDPNSLNTRTFCPSVIWDLQEDPPEIGGGFLDGDDGVVMILADPPGQILTTAPTTEIVEQFNWQYGGNPNPDGYGIPVDLVCISTICGYIIPVSNWALFLGIGLMIVATMFIYRRRMS